MRLFDIDFEVLRNLLTPKRLRGLKMLAWLRALSAPIETLYGKFSANRAANNYYLAHNSQVCRMEAVLNDRWDAGMRRIKIQNGTQNLPPYAPQEETGTALYVGAVYAPQTSATLIGADFIVQVPGFISFQESEMRGLIDRYRLPSKHNYLIVTI